MLPLLEFFVCGLLFVDTRTKRDHARNISSCRFPFLAYRSPEELLFPASPPTAYFVVRFRFADYATFVFPEVEGNAVFPRLILPNVLLHHFPLPILTQTIRILVQVQAFEARLIPSHVELVPCFFHVDFLAVDFLAAEYNLRHLLMPPSSIRSSHAHKYL